MQKLKKKNARFSLIGRFFEDGVPLVEFVLCLPEFCNGIPACSTFKLRR